MKLPAVALGAALVLYPSIALAQTEGNATRGLAFARSHCASGCHNVDGGKRQPNDAAVSFRDIANTPGFTRAALLVWFRTPHQSMPDLVLGPDVQRDLVAHILSLKEKP